MAKNTQMALNGNVARGPFWERALPFLSKSPELILAAGILMILGLLVLPLPPFLLDLLLALNLSISVLIILVAVYLTTPLDFSSFPTILLLTTMFRLGLNVASTRLILGEAQAGEIIHAFGTFVIKGNYVVGIIIF